MIFDGIFYSPKVDSCVGHIRREFSQDREWFSEYKDADSQDLADAARLERFYVYKVGGELIELHDEYEYYFLGVEDFKNNREDKNVFKELFLGVVGVEYGKEGQ